MDGAKPHTARRERWSGSRRHFAEVTVRATPCDGPSRVVLLPAVYTELRRVFRDDFDDQSHNVWSAVMVQIGTANVAGEMPHVGSTGFSAEVIDLRLSGDAGRELTGFLITIAGMDAIAAYLTEWENERREWSEWADRA